MSSELPRAVAAEQDAPLERLRAWREANPTATKAEARVFWKTFTAVEKEALFFAELARELADEDAGARTISD